MKYGLHFRSWDGLYQVEQLPRFVQQAKDLEAETFEAAPPPCVLACDRVKIRELRKSLDDVGLIGMLADTIRQEGRRTKILVTKL